MGKTVPKRQLALGGVRHVILTKIRDDIGQWPVKIEPPLFGKLQDYRGGSDNL